MSDLRKLILFSCLLLANTSYGQLKYNRPTHYNGIFHSGTTSTRAAGMGLTTITLEGVETSFYNPATIGLIQDKINVHLNYSSGSEVEKNGQFPFIGATYRINEDLIVGASTFSNIREKNSPWTTIIGGYEELQTRTSQSFYNIMAAYQVIPGLQVGLSGNYLVDRSVDDAVTNSEFILSLGGVYDMEVDWIKLENFENQKSVLPPLLLMFL